METMDRFQRRLNQHPSSTQRNIRYGLNMLNATKNLNYDHILELARTNMDELKIQVSEAMKMKRDQGFASGTADMIPKAVTFFLRAYSIHFDMDGEYLPRVIHNGSKAMKKDHIREVYDSFTPAFKKRNRAILMLMKDSGLRVSDVANLTAEHYLGAEEIRNEAGEKFRVFEPLNTQKTGDISHIHLGPESVEAVETYLNGRKTGPLFLRMEGGRGPGKNPRSDGGMDPKSISEMFINLKNRRELKQSYKKISAHSTRKFHFTSLQHLGENAVRWLQGKSTSEYFDDPEGFPQDYIDSYDQLRVFTSDVVKDLETQTTLSKQAKRIEDLEKIVKKLYPLIPEMDGKDAPGAVLLSDLQAKTLTSLGKGMGLNIEEFIEFLIKVGLEKEKERAR